jgi:hypothetical protein
MRAITPSTASTPLEIGLVRQAHRRFVVAGVLEAVAMMGEHVGLDVRPLPGARILGDPRLDDRERRVDVQQGERHPGLGRHRTKTVAQEAVRESVVDHDATAAGERRPGAVRRHQAGLLPFRIGDHLAAVEAALGVDPVIGDQLDAEHGRNPGCDGRLAGERQTAGGDQFRLHLRTLPKCTAR